MQITCRFGSWNRTKTLAGQLVKSRMKSHRTGVNFLVLVLVLRLRKELALGDLDDDRVVGTPWAIFAPLLRSLK